MTRTDILNRLIRRFNYDTYLEIGTAWGENYRQITGVYHKVCVDPQHAYPNITHRMTSDEYFASILPTDKFDLVFIDGLHVTDQVDKDIENSLDHLNDGGRIVLHDSNPIDEEWELPNRNGDVWKSILKLRMKRKDLSITTVDTDYGCCIIRKNDPDLFNTAQSDKYNIFLADNKIRNIFSFNYFNEERRQILNLISEDEFLFLLNESRL